MISASLSDLVTVSLSLSLFSGLLTMLSTFISYGRQALVLCTGYSSCLACPSLISTCLLPPGFWIFLIERFSAKWFKITCPLSPTQTHAHTHTIPLIQLHFSPQHTLPHFTLYILLTYLNKCMCLNHENLSSMKAWILVLFVHYGASNRTVLETHSENT